LREVGLQHVARHDFEPGVTGEFLAQMVYQDGVELDGDDAVGPRQQFFRERTLPGADFDDEFLPRPAGRRRDALQNGAADQEVLTEFLARQPINPAPRCGCRP
jgi:hypothetical protein